MCEEYSVSFLRGGLLGVGGGGFGLEFCKDFLMSICYAVFEVVTNEQAGWTGRQICVEGWDGRVDGGI